MANEQSEPDESGTTRRETTTTPADDGVGGLSERQVDVLLRLLRVAYPHPRFPDGPYERTAKDIQDADVGDELLPDGLDGLDEAAGGDFVALDDEAAVALIERIDTTPFFKLVHATTVVRLYDDHEVWELLGYEGSSFDKGGYLHRGFDDLDWLPKPRVEEFPGEPRPELVDGGTQ